MPIQSRSSVEGGAANLVGIHYQLLRSLFRALRILRIDFEPNTEAPSWSRLVIEPKGGGGDLALTGDSGVCVEQMKTKTSGTWSLSDIVDDILPDLFKAVPTDLADPPLLHALFVSDANKGRWSQPLYRMFQPEDGHFDSKENWLSYDELDNHRDLSRLGKAFVGKIRDAGFRPSARGFFDYIARSVTSESEQTESGKVIAPNVLHRVESLLRVFEFQRITVEELKAEVERQLLHRIRHKEDLRITLGALLQDLMEKGGRNEALDPKEVLVNHGLASVDLGDQELLRIQSQERLKVTTQALGYRRDWDIRPCRANPWDVGQPGDGYQRVFLPRVLCGPSGSGKSWRIMSEALECADGPNPVVLIEAASDRQQILDRIAQNFCHHIWGHDNWIPLERIHSRLGSLRPSVVASSWLDVFVDGVPSIETARSLLAYNWNGLGIRLTFSMTPEIESHYLEPGEVTLLPDFDGVELLNYLELRLDKDKAITMPFSRHPAATLIRRPLFAKLYCDIAEERSFRPATEFELLNEFWSQRASGAPIASARLAKLAAELPNGRRYPWSFYSLDEAGLDQACLDDLTGKNCGLLVLNPEDGGARLLHDRVLRWSVARGLADLYLERRLSLEGLAERAENFWKSHHRKEVCWGNLWLGQTLFDLFWLLLDPAALRVEAATEIFKKVRRQNFQTESLAILGPRAKPLLLELVRAQLEWRRPVCRVLEECLPQGTLVETACLLLDHEERDQKLLGAEILIKAPSSDALPKIWTLFNDLLREEEPDWFDIFNTVEKALFACSVEAGSWIEATLQASPPQSSVSTLVSMLPSTIGGEAVWHRQKKLIQDLVPTEKERCVAYCIEQFRDESLVPWLEVRAAHRDDDVGAAARSALSGLRPDRPIDPLPGDGHYLAMARHWWLLPHFHRPSQGVSDFLTETLSGFGNPWTRARLLFQDLENHIPPEILRDILQYADSRFSPTSSSEESQRHLPRFVEFLASIFRIELLVVLEDQGAQNLGEKVRDWLIERGPNNTRSFSWERKSAIALLKRIGDSQGVRQVAEHWIENADTWWSLRDAVDLAVLSPDSRSGDLLLKVGLRDESDTLMSSRPALTGLLELNQMGRALAVCRKQAHHLSWELADALAQRSFPEAKLVEIRAALINNESPEPNDLYLLILGRQEQDKVLIDHLSDQAPLGSELARMAMLGFYLIKSLSAENLYLKHLKSPNTSYVSILGLLQLRTPSAMTALQKILLEPDEFQKKEGYPRLIAANLLGFPDTQQTIAQKLWAAGDLLTTESLVDGHWDAFFLHAGDEARRWIRDYALSESSFIRSRQLGAIDALVEHEPETAFKAAQRQIELGNLSLAIPRQLLKADREKGIRFLYERLANLLDEEQFLFLSALGEIITEQFDDSDRVVIKWLEDPDSQTRQAACVVAETTHWTENLQSTLEGLMDDSDWDVRQASVKALDSLWRAREHERLVDLILEEGNLLRRRRLLDIAIETGNPGLFATQNWVSKLADGFEPIHRIRMKRILKDRRKELKSDLEKRKR